MTSTYPRKVRVGQIECSERKKFKGSHELNTKKVSLPTLYQTKYKNIQVYYKWVSKKNLWKLTSSRNRFTDIVGYEGVGLVD